MNKENIDLVHMGSSKSYNPWQQRIVAIFPWIMAATLFFIPLGSTLKSIALPLALISILSVPSQRILIPELFHTFWCKSAFLFFTIVLLACLWSPASLHNQWEIVSKFLKVLFLPVLVAGFSSSKTRRISLHAFIAAMLLTALVSFYYAYIAQVELENDVAGSVFRNHIMTSFMMSLAVFISIQFGLQTNIRYRYFYFLIAVLLSWQIFFINQGRTGYLAYLLMSAIFLMDKLSFKYRIAALFGIAFFSLATYHFSPILQSRIQEGISDIKTLREGNFDTSLGYRIRFHRYARQKFQEAPLLGHGTGSFTRMYDQDQPVASWSWKLLEPHSQYWLVAVEQGLLGLAALLTFFAALFWQGRKMKENRLLFFMLFIPFILGNFTDSLLLYSGTGYIFIVLSALCLAETVFDTQRKLK